MEFRVHDRVEHIHYPGTSGSVVALYGPVVVVLWDERKKPHNVNNSPNLPQRTSRHIPEALELV
tara:strand:- start:66 stop:257 length:192 start_codon:yes stop_codon:yes gene_type:complete